MNEEQLKNSLIKNLLHDRRSDRLWRNLRFFVGPAIFLSFLTLFFLGSAHRTLPHGPYVSLVRLNGTIMPQHAFSVQYSLPAIKQAFADKASKGVILLINSPGGSAAQASIIHDRLLELKKQYHKKPHFTPFQSYHRLWNGKIW